MPGPLEEKGSFCASDVERWLAGQPEVQSAGPSTQGGSGPLAPSGSGPQNPEEPDDQPAAEPAAVEPPAAAGPRPTLDDCRRVLENHSRLSSLIPLLFKNTGLRAPAGYQAERLAEMLEYRFGPAALGTVWALSLCQHKQYYCERGISDDYGLSSVNRKWVFP